MTTVVSNQPISLNGTQQIPSTALNAPDGTTGWFFSLARDTTQTPTFWTNVNTKLDASFEVSFDGGTTWEGGGGVTGASGGIQLERDGVTQLPASTFTFGLRASPTHFRGTVTVTNGPLVSQLTAGYLP